MHLGLIGGVGPAATDLYYRGLIAALAEREASLQMTIAHADAPTLLANMAAGETEAQAEIFANLIDRLKRAGAEVAAVSSTSGHFCQDALAEISPLPLIDLRAEVARAVAAEGRRRLGLLGTLGVMESRFFGHLTGVEILIPDDADRRRVHETYVAMVAEARCDAAARTVFVDAGRRLIEDQGAEAVMLGSTDLFLAFDDADPGFPTVDCARIHIAALADQAAR